MADEEPWDRYDRDKLPKGWAYPLGRDEVCAALVAAGVRLGSPSAGLSRMSQAVSAFCGRPGRRTRGQSTSAAETPTFAP